MGSQLAGRMRHPRDADQFLELSAPRDVSYTHMRGGVRGSGTVMC